MTGHLTPYTLTPILPYRCYPVSGIVNFSPRLHVTACIAAGVWVLIKAIRYEPPPKYPEIPVWVVVLWQCALISIIWAPRWPALPLCQPASRVALPAELQRPGARFPATPA